MTKSTRIHSTTCLFGFFSALSFASGLAVAQTATPPDSAAAGASAPSPAEPVAPSTTASTPSVDPTPAPVPAPTAAQLEPAKPEAPAKPDRPSQLAIGEGGGLKLSGLVQVWGVYQNQEGISPSSDHASTVRLRRGEIKVSGDLVPKKFSFGVMVDVAKLPKFGSATAVTAPEEDGGETGTAKVLTAAKDNSILQDVYVTYHAPWFDLSAGQFKTPLSYESATSSSKLLLPERAAVVRAFGEQRELGLKIEKKYDHFGYVLGAYNGSGINQVDTNLQKDVALRLEAYPVKGITIGAVGYTSLGQRDEEASTKDRLEGDIAFSLGDLVAQGEYIHAWTGATGSDTRVEGKGWYGAVGYTVAKVLQPVVRVGRLDPDVDTNDTTLTTVEAGINYFALKDTVKLQLAYAHTGSQAAGSKPLSEVVLAGQFKY